MQKESVLDGLMDTMPVDIEDVYSVNASGTGGVFIDLVKGFCDPGGGNMAPPFQDKEIEEMVTYADSFAKELVNHNRPGFVFLDTHYQDKPEPPYPLHCIIGSGEEEIVDTLKWMEKEPLFTLFRKDCINGVIGAITENNNNIFFDWVKKEKIVSLVQVGICTDICDMQFVQSVLSARNHGILGDLEEVVVAVEGCATYHLPKETALQTGLPPTAAHDREIAQHMALYFLQASGAILANRVDLV